MPKIDSETKPVKATNGKTKTKPVNTPQANKSDVKKSDAKGKAKTNGKTPAKPAEDKKPSKVKPTKQEVIPVEKRPVKYPQIKVELLQGEKALTIAGAKKLLGWEEETDEILFGSEFQYTTSEGKKVRWHNNVGNRPFEPQLARTYTSEMLNRRWRLNGETIVIGKTGVVESGQHRLVGFIEAVLVWLKDPDRWLAYWEKEPTLDCLIVYGIEETDEVVNTIDTGKSRSLANVIFRSEYFAKLDDRDKNRCAKLMEHAIKWLYYRVGAQPDAFAVGKTVKRTHGESLDFLDRHPRLIECVKHIWEEDDNTGKIKKYLSLGYAAATLYMMGCSSSNPKEYHESEKPNEDMLDWENYDKALEFWTALGGGDKDLGAMRQALGDLLKEGLVSTWTQSALLSKAWHKYVTGEKLLPSDLEIEWNVDEETEAKTIGECPVFGGIDQGSPEEKKGADPTPEEIAKHKASIKSENQNGKLVPVKKKMTTDAKINDRVHVAEIHAAPWDGELVDIVGDQAKVKDEEDKIYEVDLDIVSKLKAKPATAKPVGKAK